MLIEFLIPKDLTLFNHRIRVYSRHYWINLRVNPQLSFRTYFNGLGWLLDTWKFKITYFRAQLHESLKHISYFKVQRQCWNFEKIDNVENVEKISWGLTRTLKRFLESRLKESLKTPRWWIWSNFINVEKQMDFFMPRLYSLDEANKAFLLKKTRCGYFHQYQDVLGVHRKPESWGQKLEKCEGVVGFSEPMILEWTKIREYDERKTFEN